MASLKGHTTPAKTAKQLPKNSGPDNKSLMLKGRSRPKQSARSKWKRTYG